MRRLFSAVVLGLCVATTSLGAQQPASPIFTLEEVMVPMRDGAHLQTVIMRPVGHTEPLPILITRTPYGVPSQRRRACRRISRS